MKSIIINLPVTSNATAMLLRQLNFELLLDHDEFTFFTDGTAIFRLDKIAKYGKGVLLYDQNKTGHKAIDPAGVEINWVEQALFHQNADGDLRSPSGQFYEISVGVGNEDFKATISFWLDQGFSIVENDPDIHSYVTLQWEALKLSVYKKVQCPHIFNSPALTYFEKDMLQRIEQLRSKGITFQQELKNKEGVVDSAIIETAEGYHLFLFAY